MKFTGDEQGIAALKKMKDERLDYLKYVLQEARTNFGNKTTFKDNDQKYQIEYDPLTGDLDVQKIDS